MVDLLKLVPWRSKNDSIFQERGTRMSAAHTKRSRFSLSLVRAEFATKAQKASANGSPALFVGEWHRTFSCTDRGLQPQNKAWSVSKKSSIQEGGFGCGGSCRKAIKIVSHTKGTGSGSWLSWWQNNTSKHNFMTRGSVGLVPSRACKPSKKSSGGRGLTKCRRIASKAAITFTVQKLNQYCFTGGEAKGPPKLALYKGIANVRQTGLT